MSVQYICDYCGASQDHKLTYPNNIFWMGEKRLEGNGACDGCWDKLHAIGNESDRLRKQYIHDEVNKMFDLKGVQPRIGQAYEELNK